MEFSRFLGLLNTSTSAARVILLVSSRPSKRVATGLCYQAHPGRDQSQKVVNGVTEYCYRIVSAVQLSNTMTTSSITSTSRM